jgi:hypothetical protein
MIAKSIVVKFKCPHCGVRFYKQEEFVDGNVNAIDKIISKSNLKNKQCEACHKADISFMSAVAEVEEPTPEPQKMVRYFLKWQCAECGTKWETIEKCKSFISGSEKLDTLKKTTNCIKDDCRSKEVMLISISATSSTR